MVDIIEILLITLASARITRFIMHDTAGSWPRSLIVWSFGSKYEHHGLELIECPWCLGFWISLIAVGLAQFELGILALAPWAISYAVGILEGELF